jgi:hypothetical protein
MAAAERSALNTVRLTKRLFGTPGKRSISGSKPHGKLERR